MKVKSLRYYLFVILTLLFSLHVSAQAFRFVYLQTENKQPFYVKLGKSTFNSSPSGFMIIPKLYDSTYECIVGFPAGNSQGYQFTIKGGTGNAGFLLKKESGQAWTLLNLQTMQPVPFPKIETTVAQDSLVPLDNEFARVLARVVNDPSIAMVTVRKNEVQSTPAKTDNVKEKNNQVIESGKKTIMDSLPGRSDVLITEIIKLEQKDLAAGTHLTYVDRQKSGSDTIKLYMPAEPTAIVKQKDTVQGGSLAADKTETPEVEKKSTAVNSGEAGMINSDCRKFATEKDFKALQKNMTSKVDENEMFKSANRQFLKTCFTSAQIKSLGILFLNEENRYKFFVAAYPFVSDTHNFSTLEDQLTDNHYKDRFKAMLAR